MYIHIHHLYVHITVLPKYTHISPFFLYVIAVLNLIKWVFLLQKTLLSSDNIIIHHVHVIVHYIPGGHTSCDTRSLYDIITCSLAWLVTLYSDVVFTWQSDLLSVSSICTCIYHCILTFDYTFVLYNLHYILFSSYLCSVLHRLIKSAIIMNNDKV